MKDKSRGYLLTDLGSQLVSDLYRKHRLIEVFLLEKLDYTTEEVHEGQKFSSIPFLNISLTSWITCLELLRPALTVGQFKERRKACRSLPRPSQRSDQPGLYILQRVHDTYELLKFLDQIHLQIGDTIAFQRYGDYTGLYHLVIHGQEISINQVIAQQLYIEKHAV